MKFRKKPIVIDAEQFVLASGVLPAGVEKYRPTIAELEKLIDQGTKHALSPDGYCYVIKTLEGMHFVADGDYVITGVRGERYPIKSDILWETYDPVIDEPAQTSH